jgi:hypothetical protein
LKIRNTWLYYKMSIEDRSAIFGAHYVVRVKKKRIQKNDSLEFVSSLKSRRTPSSTCGQKFIPRLDFVLASYVTHFGVELPAPLVAFRSFLEKPVPVSKRLSFFAVISVFVTCMMPYSCSRSRFIEC